MLPQPVHKLLHFRIPPHPTGKVVEDAAWDATATVRVLPDVVIDRTGVWPIGFDGEDVIAMPLDETLRNGSTSTVEF